MNASTVGFIGDGFYGTVRARAGFAFDRFLVFATGGAIVADHDAYMESMNSGGIHTNKTGTQFGWTAGAGVEYAVTDNWSVKLDALYYDLGNKTVHNGTHFSGPRFEIQNTGELVRLGANYKF